MCNLNILITNKPSSNKYAQLLDRLTTLSYDGNQDADGVYFSGTNRLIKSTYKLNYLSFIKGFNSSKFVISHQRISTSGFEESNHQPFSNRELVMAHNGVLSITEVGDKSDTHTMFDKFSKEFKKALKTLDSREKAMLKTIKELFAVETGSYSIFIYDKIDGVGYYFKNLSTTIYAYHTDNYTYLSTRDTSFWHDPKHKEFSIKSGKIYKITVNTKSISFKPVDNIPSRYGYDDYDEYDSYGRIKGRYSKNVSTIKNVKDKRFIGYCDECGLNTMVMERPRFNYDILCKSCYDFRREYEHQNSDGYPREYELTDEEWEKLQAKRYGVKYD